MNSAEYKLVREDFVVGIIDATESEPRETELFGRLDFVEEIKGRVGWKARRYADMFHVWANFFRIAHEEEQDESSAEYQSAYDALCQGEIDYYLSSDEWYVVDPEGRARPIELLVYRNDGLFMWNWKPEGKLPDAATKPRDLFHADRDLMGFRLVVDEKGRHPFGGPALHRGVTPEGTDTPLHHFLTLDLADPRSPFHFDPDGIRYLPLYYPLAYGYGGGEVQYEVVSDDEIRIIYMGDEEPDPKEHASFLEPMIPPARADIVQLTYEEFRHRLFSAHASFVDFNEEDDRLREKLGGNDAVFFGTGGLIRSGYTWTCHNGDCPSFEKEIPMESILMIPPIPVGGETEFWHDFEGAFMDFVFCLCPDCRKIFATNVCT